MLICRLALAGLFGGLIGLEREVRAKEAGVRTHFVVALGSALFMIISQYAFGDSHHDSARVAAQVVSGIGFIGAGVIIFQKNVVRGVTTAAGLWVAAAIGLSCGGGMYILALGATVLTIIVLETMNFLHSRYEEKQVSMTLASDKEEDMFTVLEAFKKDKVRVDSYSYSKGKVQITFRIKMKKYEETIRRLLSRLEGFSIEDLN